MACVRAGDGRRLAYHVRGSGHTLICHPGGPGLSSRLLGDLGGLEQEARLILLDPRGTGGSDRPAQDDGYRSDDYAGDLELLRDRLGLRRCALLAHSAGGLAALTYAAAYPQRVACLVLVGAFARFAEEYERDAAAMRAARADEPWYDNALSAGDEYARADRSISDTDFAHILADGMGFCFVRSGPREAAYAAALREEGVNVAAWMGFDERAEDVRPLLANIAAPTLVVVGDADCVAVPAAARELAEGLPRSRLVVVPNAGHYPWVDEPDAFRSTVAAFLREQPELE